MDIDNDDSSLNINYITSNDNNIINNRIIINNNLKGSWKKKRIIQKINLHKLKKNSINDHNHSTTNATNTTANTTAPVDSNTTKSKNNDNSSSRNTSNSKLTSHKKTFSSANGITKKKAGSGASVSAETGGAGGSSSTKPLPSTFISSLFTSNPTIAIPEKRQPARAAQLKSSIHSGKSTFIDVGIDHVLANHLERNGMTKPTKIQSIAIPAALRNSAKDICIHSSTGTGKTLAYLLPILQNLISWEKRLLASSSNDSSQQLSRSIGTVAIIVVPTRELAKQISGVLELILRYSSKQVSSSSSSYSSDDTATTTNLRHWIVGGVLAGGEKKKSEKAKLRKGITILVCTPGRLLDHLKSTKSFEVSSLRWLILDEADRLLDLGFERTLKEIFEQLEGHKQASTKKRPPLWESHKQVVLVSATLQGRVLQLAKEILKSPILLRSNESSSSSDTSNQPESSSSSAPTKFNIPSQLSQSYVIVPAKLRLVTLVGVLRSWLSSSHDKPKLIVFVSTCDAVEFLYTIFSHDSKAVKKKEEADVDDEDQEDNDQPKLGDNNNVPKDLKLFPSRGIFKLHGNMSQKLRNETVSKFAQSTHSFLICTDVAARGLDFEDISGVVQFDLPYEISDYVHRVGRTARIGKAGEAVTFLLPHETGYVKELEDRNIFLESQDSRKYLETLLQPCGFKASMKSNDRTVESSATTTQMWFETLILADPKIRDIARAAFVSGVRSYMTHSPSERHIFNIKEVHLGHLAKSFALRDPPKVAGSKTGAATETSHPGKPQFNLKRKAANILRNSGSEFADGVKVAPKKKKTG